MAPRRHAGTWDYYLNLRRPRKSFHGPMTEIVSRFSSRPRHRAGCMGASANAMIRATEIITAACSRGARRYMGGDSLSVGSCGVCDITICVPAWAGTLLSPGGLCREPARRGLLWRVCCKVRIVEDDVDDRGSIRELGFPSRARMSTETRTRRLVHTPQIRGVERAD